MGLARVAGRDSDEGPSEGPATTAFTFKTLLRHYAKRALTPWSLNVKLGLQRNCHKGQGGPSRGLLHDYEPSDGPF